MSVCAPEEQLELYRSKLYTGTLFFNLTIGIASIVLIALAVRSLLKESIINVSTRIFLVVGLLFSTSHQTAYIVLRVQVLYQIFFRLDYPCDLYYQAFDCRFITFGLVAGNAGMILIQSAMTIEQTMATAMTKLWPKLKQWPGIFLSGLVIFLDYVLMQIIFHEDPLTDYVPTCGSLPPKSVNRFTVFLSIAFCMSIVNMVVNVILLLVNRCQYSRQRLVEEYSRSFNVNDRYQSRETLKTTQAIFILSMAQFVFMLLYTVFTNVFLANQSRLTPLQSGLVLAMIYTTPYTCLASPSLIMLTLCFIKNQRMRSINQMRSQKQTGEEYMKSVQEQWNK